MRNIGKPTRSASSILKESTPKSPTEEVKAKLGLIECSASKPPNVSLAPVRPPSSEKDETDEKQYRPTLSPFSLTANTPKVNKEKKKLFETPQGFNFNIFESLSKQQTEKKRVQNEAVKDVVTSLDFQNSSLDDGTVPMTNVTLDDEQRSVFLENESTCCIGEQNVDVSNQPNYPQEIEQKKNSSNFDKILAQVDDDIKKSRSLLNQAEHKINHALFQTPGNKIKNAKFQTPGDNVGIKSDFNNGKFQTPINILDSRKQSNNPPFETPRDKLEMQKAEDLVQRTCPKRAKGPPSTRKPLTEIKGPRNPDIAKENAFNSNLKKRIPFKDLSTPGNKPRREIPRGQQQSVAQPLAKTGLTELIQSIDLLKENSPPNQTDIVNDRIPKVTQPSQNNSTIANNMRNTANSQPSQTIISKKTEPISQQQQNRTLVINSNEPKITNNTNNDHKTYCIPQPLQQQQKSIPANPHQQRQQPPSLNSRQQDARGIQVIPTPKETSPPNMNNQLQNAIQTLGMNGFNMDQKLEPVPTDSRFIKINGRPYTRVKKIARGGFCKVSGICFLISYFTSTEKSYIET